MGWRPINASCCNASRNVGNGERKDDMQRFIRINELASRKGQPGRWPVGPSTVWRWVSKGLLTPPTKLGPQTSAWPIEAIEAFEAAQASAPINPVAQIRAAAASVAARQEAAA